MKNKQVKQMICDVMNSEYECSYIKFEYGHGFGYWKGGGIYGHWFHQVNNARVTLTANQLKGE